jgi:hypothetical protein
MCSVGFPHSEASFEVLGPVIDHHGVHVNKEANYTLQSSTLLLHRRLHDEDVNTLTLLPDISAEEEPGDKKNQELNVRCFISTKRKVLHE